MKTKTNNPKPKMKTVITISILSFVVLTLAVLLLLCNTVTNIFLADGSYFIDEFELSNQNLMVEYLLGQDRQVKIMPSMLSDEDNQKLAKTGKHQITINYRFKKITATFTIYDMAVEDFLFGIVDEKNCMVIDYVGTKSSVAIKNIYEGRVITGINDYAFYQKNITSVHLSPSVKIIGAYAFALCQNLKNINLDNVLSFGEGAFKQTALEKIIFSDDIQIVSIGILAECASLTKITIPFIPEGYLGYLFGSMSSMFNASYIPPSLKEIVVTEYQDEIVGYCFFESASLESITYTQGIGTIGDGAFSGTSNLKNVILNSLNYRIVEGVVYSYDLKELVLYPSGKSDVTYKVLNDTQTIGAFAFDNNKLTNINFNNVSHIGVSAFRGSQKLETLELGIAIEEIKEGAFADCLILETVIFNSYVRLFEAVFLDCVNLQYIYTYELMELDYANALINPDMSKKGPVILVDETLLDQYLEHESWQAIREHLFSDHYVPFKNETYRYLKSTDIIILEYYGIDQHLVIPSKIDNLNVLAIGPRAFVNHDLVTLVVGNNIETIHAFSFFGITTLETVTLGADMQKINEAAFFGCNNLKLVTLTNEEQMVELHYQSVTNPSGNTIDLHAFVQVPPSLYQRYQEDIYWQTLGKKIVTEIDVNNILENEHYRYYDSDDGIYLIKHLASAEDIGDTLVIPTEINQKQVTTILSHTFVNLLVTNIFLEEMFDLEPLAFFDCTDIVTIYVPGEWETNYIEQFNNGFMEELSQKICQIDKNSV